MFYLLDKPKGISSFKFIKEFARENNIKKIGHTGTLDPAATGLILVATDDDTKLIDYIDKGNKKYEAEIQFGFKSDTYDSEGNITATDIIETNFTDDIKSFVGEYKQTPPIFSAKKINGVRSYKLAREGKEVRMKPVLVNIKNIWDISEIDRNKFKFKADVSRGTFIRSLVVDIAAKSNNYAYLTSLRRIEVAGLDETCIGNQIPVKDILNIDLIEIKNIKDLFDGKPQPTQKTDGTYAVNRGGEILGIVIVKDNLAKPKKLFGNKL